MCGIAGALNFDGRPVSAMEVETMAAALAHRGPDDAGVHVEGCVGLGHRRLSIIDLSAHGRQPMRTPDGRYALSYNGEVYNYRELRRELEAEGAAFRSHTDSEVVLQALARWGARAFERFNGMFALALWDGEARKLTLARDRYGIKPLYYSRQAKQLLFASEVKGLLASPVLHARIDLPAMLEYFTFQNFFTDRTLFEGVHLLPPGCYLEIDLESNESRRTRYWDFDFSEPEAPLGEGEYLEQLDHLFAQAVKRQLVSDVPVNAYLSGGMDSGSITAVARRHLEHLQTFTVGFDLSSASGMELAFDERQAAEHLSYAYQTEHYEMVLKAGDMERCMGAVVRALEEPRVGQSYPNYYAAKLASRFGKVVLSGTGGDEMFGGYPWRYFRAIDSASFEHYVDEYYLYWQRLIPNRLVKAVFAPVWNEVEHVWTRDIFRDVFASHAERLTRPEDYVNHSLYLEAKTFLHGLLVMEDKLAMAHGLEVRVPFLDNDLVDFAQALPVASRLATLEDVKRVNENELGPKSRRYFERTSDGKKLLRRMMQRYLPEGIADRAKQGFSAPDASWFRGESIDYVRRRLMTPDALIYNYLDRKTVQALVDEHLSGEHNRRLLVWSLLYVEEWCRTFVPG